MPIAKSIRALQSFLQKARLKKKTIGFVPTMGALHEGHLSLIRRSKKENDLAVLSIFVNPTQFGPQEDFKNYPRELEKDILLAKKENVDIIFYPSVEEMYPHGYRSYVEVKELGNVLCGQFRPGHFQGVATVVAKLLNIVEPQVLYLGQKDAQQAIILGQMVKDLNFRVKVKICPTVRGEDGLALSSRNIYLTEEERREAPVLYQSLLKAKQKIEQGENNPQTITEFIHEQIEQNSSGKIQYIECVDTASLKPLTTLKGKILIALAVFFGKTRLIDNIVVSVS